MAPAVEDWACAEPQQPQIAELPEVLSLLADVIGDDEQDLVATAELAARIGWDAKSLGEAMRPPMYPRRHRRDSESTA